MSTNAIETRLNAKADTILERRVNSLMTEAGQGLNKVITGFRTTEQTVTFTVGTDTVTMDIRTALQEIALAARGHLTTPFRDELITRFIAKAEAIIDQEAP